MSLPHLGKHIPSFALDDARALLANRINTFKSLRSQAGVDVNDIFTNDFLDSLIFPDVQRTQQDQTPNVDASNSGAGRAEILQKLLSVSFVMFMFVW